MDNSSFLIGIFILLIFVVPVVWVIYKSNKKSKKQIKLVKDLCNKNGMIVDYPTQVGNALVGIDFQNKKMFYTSLLDLEKEFQIIPIHSILDLHVIEELYSGKEIIENVLISISTKEKKYLLNIYDDNIERQVVNDAKTCLHEAKQWLDKVKTELL